MVVYVHKINLFVVSYYLLFVTLDNI
jgi:hypothetical protein